MPKRSSSSLKHRVSRLQGQVSALLNLMDSDKDWEKKILLSSAIEGAADQVTAELFQEFLNFEASGKIDSTRIQKLLNVVLKRL